MKYTKKPVTIEAIQWTGLNLEEVKSFVGDSLHYDIIDTAWEVGKGAPRINMIIKTLEGNHICTEGDYIIKGVQGEFYPCKPDIFEMTYDIHENKMTFGQALELVKKGKCIARKGWNGKNQYVFLVKGETLRKCFNDKVNAMATPVDVLAIKTTSNQIQVGWLATQTDMLADDWYDVDEEA